MATIVEDYVSFETAKLLKEKGFKTPVETGYYGDGRICHNLALDFMDYNHEDGYYSRPTIQMAMKWLRKVHKIAIVIDCWFGGENYINWHGKIMCYGEELKTQQDVDMPYVATYEKACEASILYCLKNLI